MAANHPGVVYGRRVAIVDGLRTPFVKAGTDFKVMPIRFLLALERDERSGGYIIHLPANDD